METRRRSVAGGAVPVSRGSGGVAMQDKDRQSGDTVTQRAHILEGSQALRMILDGDVEYGVNGFAVSTNERMLFVPHTKTADAAVAILLCRQGGIIREKLTAMDDAAAAFTYATTLAVPNVEN